MHWVHVQGKTPVCWSPTKTDSLCHIDPAIVLISGHSFNQLLADQGTVTLRAGFLSTVLEELGHSELNASLV